MKSIYLLGVILMIIAAIYLLLPADQLPSFLPGFDSGLPRIRLKHGLVAGGAAIVSLLIGWFIGRRRA